MTGKIHGVLVRIVVSTLRIYQRVISPFLGSRCRFWPSCSEYAVQALDRHGIRRGGGMALKRLLRCGPWRPGGIDPVP